MNVPREVWRRWYSTKRWAAMKARQRRKEPRCQMCREVGVMKPMDVVDHIRQHKGDPALFWDENNLQSLCKRHHDSNKQREERRGFDLATGADGWPISPDHPFNRHGT